ncbi:type I-B CRISPR-associated protein Cas5b [Clostridium culturomicium]|uniref:type I-B CRISPR-associated protein Cas5b n=1 Tax=Clostridium culturomicium TaxID=1499683 RepID=UPI00058C323B|nr:type I-B CRISPR-associated protein Cas5b [Clostridium culturomicium]
MKILKFKLWGKTAFFKKPDVNTYMYFTYGNIHKVALLGLLGAVVGYGGYNQFEAKRRCDKKFRGQYPEFYEKLKSIKVGIEPNNEGAFICKKIQVFNNSVGYASKEMGGNLIVKEQWLENPSWNIYLLVNNEEAENITEAIINRKSVFTPYLGKNDHSANITDIEVFDGCSKVERLDKINSLCFKEDVTLSLPESDWAEEVVADEEYFKYTESLPVGLDEETNLYIMKSFVYSNMDVDSIRAKDIYKVQNKNIIFI